MTGKITANFTWEEFEQSAEAVRIGIENTIPDESIAAQIRALTVTVLQPLRDACGHALTLNSGYRTPELNKAVKGAKNSQHMSGQAADIASGNPIGLARKVIALGLEFDQMILYPAFVHLSHTTQRKNRRQVLYGKSYTGNKL